MRFLFAILMAMAALAKGGLQLAWVPFQWGLDKLSSLGGGGGGPAAPRSMLDLPDADEAKDAIAEARGQQQAVEFTLSTPARQMMAWTQSTPEQRDTIPLTLLSDDQVDWLETRSRDEIKAIASEKNERKIEAALKGQEDAIFGLVSFGIKTRRPTPLEERIVAFRSGDLERPPAFVH